MGGGNLKKKGKCKGKKRVKSKTKGKEARVLRGEKKIIKEHVAEIQDMEIREVHVLCTKNLNTTFDSILNKYKKIIIKRLTHYIQFHDPN